MKPSRLALFGTALGLAAGLAQALPYQHYNGEPQSPTMELPNGALAPQLPLASMQQNMPNGKRAVKLDEGIWQLSGYYFYNPTVVELKRGLMVFDSGESMVEGKAFREIIREQISRKPVIAVACSHSHYCKGTSGLIDGDPGVKVIAHKNMNALMAGKGSSIGSVNIPEMMPLAAGRAQIQFNHYLPKQGADAAYALTIHLDAESGYVPVNTPVDDGQVLQLDELKLQFFTEVTDDTVTLTTYAPERRTILSNNVLWPAMPNIYTLRGDTYRDPRVWAEAVRQMRDLQPEKVISLHFRPLLDAQSSLDTLNTYLDGINYVYDQTIRLANQGVGPDELGHRLQLPKAIVDSGVFVEVYGQLEHFPRAIYENAMGWFSGRAEDMHSLPASEEARRLVALAGGSERVLAQYQEAMDKREYLWASKLANYLRLTKPDSAQYRHALADSFRKLGQLSYGTIARAFYISAAEALDGQQKVALSAQPPKHDVLDEPLRYFDFLRTRLDPEKSGGYEAVLQLRLDDNQPRALHVRNGIAEFVANPAAHYRQPDMQLSCTAVAFADYYLGSLTPVQLVEGCELSAGSPQDAVGFLSKFDPAAAASLY